MRFLRVDYYSNALGRGAQMDALLPAGPAPEGGFPTLYLLHGMGDDYTVWMRRSSIERYAEDRGLAVVMPDGGLSCYENMAHGGRYRDFVAEELPRVMRETFPLSADRERNFLAGCSMGGFGALKLGLAEPEKWSAIGVLSAAHAEYRPDSLRVQAALWRVYGGDIDGCDARIVEAALRDNASGPELRIWHAWGTEDRLRESARKSRAFFESLGEGRIRYRWEELPGRHDWALWDAMAARFIEWLGLPKPEVHPF